MKHDIPKFMRYRKWVLRGKFIATLKKNLNPNFMPQGTRKRRIN